MILFYKAIKFAIGEVIFKEICVEICKKSRKFALNDQEKMSERAKSQEKIKAIWCGNPEDLT